jgi:hypothetical protein
MGSNSVLYDKKKQFYDVFLNDIGTAVHFTFENPLFTPENQPFTLHRGALSNSTAAVVHRGDVPLPSREKKFQTKKPSFTKNDKENMCGTGAQICDTMLTYINWFFV